MDLELYLYIRVRQFFLLFLIVALLVSFLVCTHPYVLLHFKDHFALTLLVWERENMVVCVDAYVKLCCEVGCAHLKQEGSKPQSRATL